MFNNSKYTKWYNNIISNAQYLSRTKTTQDYYEVHHIIPKSLGGDNTSNNLVTLTAREHYVCHLLLPKMCVSSRHKSKMVYAFMRLSESKSRNRIHYAWTGRTYEIFKKQYIHLISGKNSYMYGVPKTPEIRTKISTTRILNGISAGENNPMYGKSHAKVSTDKMSQVKKQRILERGADNHQHKQMLANPRRKPVITCDGQTFDSLSSACRSYGFRGIDMGRNRIKSGVWRYA